MNASLKNLGIFLCLVAHLAGVNSILINDNNNNNYYSNSNNKDNNNPQIFPRFLNQPPSEIYLNSLRSKWLVNVTFEPSVCQLEFVFRSSSFTHASSAFLSSIDAQREYMAKLQNVKSLDYVFVKEEVIDWPAPGRRVAIEVSGWASLKQKQLYFLLDCPQVGRLLSRPFEIKRAELGGFPLTLSGHVRYTVGNVAVLVFLLPVNTPWPPEVKIKRNGQWLDTTEASSRYWLQVDGGESASSRAVLFIHNVQTHDAGVYECEAENAELQETQRSQGIELRVEVPERVKPLTVRWISHPRDVLLLEGSTVMLSCVFEASPLPFLQWFYKPGERNVKDLVKFDSILIHNATKRNSGMYNCYATNSGTEASKSEGFMVTVVEKPRVAIEPTIVSVEVSNEDMITQRLHCLVDLTSSSTQLAWYFNTQLITKFTNPNTQSSAGPIFKLTGEQGEYLQVVGAAKDILGVYQCFVKSAMTNGQYIVLYANAVIISSSVKMKPPENGINVFADPYVLLKTSIQMSVTVLRKYVCAIYIDWTVTDVGDVSEYEYYLAYRERSDLQSPWEKWQRVRRTIKFPNDIVNANDGLKAGKEYQFILLGSREKLKSDQENVRAVFKSATLLVSDFLQLIPTKVSLIALEQKNASTLSVKWTFHDWTHPNLRVSSYQVLCYPVLYALDPNVFLNNPRLFNTDHHSISTVSDLETSVQFHKLNANVTYAIFVYAILVKKDQTLNGNRREMFSTISDGQMVQILEPRHITRSNDTPRNELADEVSNSDAASATNSILLDDRPDRYDQRLYLFIPLVATLIVVLLFAMATSACLIAINRKNNRTKESIRPTRVSTPVDSNTIQYGESSNKYMIGQMMNGRGGGGGCVDSPNANHYNVMPLPTPYYYAPSPMLHPTLSPQSVASADPYATLSHYGTTGLFMADLSHHQPMTMLQQSSSPVIPYAVHKEPPPPPPPSGDRYHDRLDLRAYTPLPHQMRIHYPPPLPTSGRELSVVMPTSAGGGYHIPSPSRCQSINDNLGTDADDYMNGLENGHMTNEMDYLNGSQGSLNGVPEVRHYSTLPRRLKRAHLSHTTDPARLL